MSALFFNIVIDWVMRRTIENHVRGIRWTLLSTLEDLARGVQTLDSAIHRINHYPADSVIDLRNTYPLDSDLSGR